MTLAAFAGVDEIWTKFDRDWNAILNGHSPRADYIHMREINTLTKGFSWKLGWNAPKAFGLAGKCLAYMSHVDKTKFRMFYCAVDLGDWAKVKRANPGLPDPIEICADFAMYGVLSWYVGQRPATDMFHLPTDSAHYFFDKDEQFEREFTRKWKAAKEEYERTGQVTPWTLVEEVTSVDMKQFPGVQAADVLAWAVNRERTAKDNQPGKMYGHIMRQVIPSSWSVFDEATLVKAYG